MIPVLDNNRKPLMPCSEKRAKKLMNKKEAKPFWQKGIFCIMLLREPSERNYQDVALGIDPGSKREGYTVATANNVVLNITTNTPNWVSSHVETRKNLRRARRQRKTPYRKCRNNRKVPDNRLPPSTRARWSAKLRIINLLRRILPITEINVEDIAAWTKPGKAAWNKSFSPLEVGKAWFYTEIKKLKILLKITKGFDTAEHRARRGFKKTKKKLDYIWEAHNVDSHSLAEMVLGANIKIYRGMYKIEFLEYYRRQLHVQNPIIDGIRKQFGGTVSLGMSRGSVLRYKNKLYYLGGTSKGRVSIYNIKDRKRVSQNIKKGDIQIMYNTKMTTQIIKGDAILPTDKSVGILAHLL